MEKVEVLDNALSFNSFDSLKGICRASSTDEGLCFWATRFDCFGDREEYKLGISVIKRLLPELEKRLQPDRRIASSFEWDEIIGRDSRKLLKTL